LKTLLLLLPLIFAFSCQKQANTSVGINSATPLVEQETTPVKEIDVKLTFDIEGKETRKPKIAGITNLPEQTKLLITVKGKNIKYTGQEETSVYKGRFESSEFSLENKELPLGEYTVDVVMPLSHTQTEGVQQIIGKNGENLKGALVVKGSLGIVVKVVQHFQLK
jgi:hypothetical protein